MVAPKLVFVFLLAIGASPAANIDVAPQPRDVRVVAQDVVQILRIMSEKIQEGMKEASPIIEDLESNLHEDLRELVRSYVQTVRSVVDDITLKVEDFDNLLVTSIETLNKEAGDCVEITDVGLDAVLKKYEGELATIIQVITENFQEDIIGTRDEFVVFVNTFTEIFFDGVTGGLACVVPGSPDVKACLDVSNEAFNTAINELRADFSDLYINVLLTANAVLGSILSEIPEVLDGVRAEAEVVITFFGTCVGNLPPVLNNTMTNELPPL